MSNATGLGNKLGECELWLLDIVGTECMCGNMDPIKDAFVPSGDATTEGEGHEDVDQDRSVDGIV